jgi:serine/threonine-protein kinase
MVQRVTELVGLASRAERSRRKLIDKVVLGTGGSNEVLAGLLVDPDGGSPDCPVAFKFRPEGDHNLSFYTRERNVYARIPATAKHLTRLVGEGEDLLVIEQWGKGETLWHRMRGEIPYAETLHFLKQIAAALNELAEIGVHFHRDLKPSNCLLGSSDDPSTYNHLRLCDFAFAGLQRDEDPEAFGTPRYIAPEIFLSQDEDPPFAAQVDVFAFVVMAYELLTGKHPFDFPENAFGLEIAIVVATDPHKTIALQSPHPQIGDEKRRTELEQQLNEFFSRGLAKSPAERFATAGECYQALAPVLQAIEDKGFKIVQSSSQREKV